MPAPRAERFKPSDAAIIAACDIGPDADPRYPKRPQSATDVAIDAARGEFGSPSAPSRTPDGRWIDERSVSVSYVKRRLDALVVSGQILSGSFERMGLDRQRGNTQTYYGTPALVRANRKRTLTQYRASVRAQAEEHATEVLVDKYRDEWQATVDRVYVDPIKDYPIEPPA